MPNPAFAAAAGQLRTWAIDKALPLWATAGVDRSSGRFREALTLDGAPVLDVPTRLIVQARQVFSYALAAKQEWHPEAHALAEHGYRAMVRDYYRPDGRPGWVYSVHRDGAIADGRRDLYSHAFAMLASSAYVRMTRSSEALAVVDETLAFIDTEMRAPASGGYVEELPQSGLLRRQNPHMHLLEAMLSLWANTGQARYLARAGELYGLFSSRFFLSEAGVLGEYFEADLAPAGGPSGAIVEPGHHCEWIWLLRWFQGVTGREVQPYVDALYDHAARFGYDAHGLLVDEITANGAPRLASHRTWPMTEALKANVVESVAGRSGASDKAAVIAGLLLDKFFTSAPAGGWMDRLDANARPAAETMPASTLYHVLGAIDVAVGAAAE
jgi:mannose/cellobiose epimerase-like protein (N-acyl-D-glucosamine 2-epimerase family)